MERTGPVEQQHVRPWSTVLRVPTADGPVWFKAANRDTGFEPALYALLERVAPERILTPLAVDEERRWLLLPDGGPTLGERAEGSALVEGFAEALPRYAELQLALAPRTEELLGLGIADMRAETMPHRFDEALDAARDYARTGEAHAGLDQVAGLRDDVAAWSERLAAAPVAPSLDHNDLHPWNVLPGAGGSVRFYDWGDAVVAHPFASALAIGFLPFELSEHDAERLRDAYLEPFGGLAPHVELVEALVLACRLGKIARTLTWHRAISAEGPDEVPERWLDGPVASLTSLLEDTWLGRA